MASSGLRTRPSKRRPKEMRKIWGVMKRSVVGPIQSLSSLEFHGAHPVVQVVKARRDTNLTSGRVSAFEPNSNSLVK